MGKVWLSIMLLVALAGLTFPGLVRPVVAIDTTYEGWWEGVRMNGPSLAEIVLFWVKQDQFCQSSGYTLVGCIESLPSQSFSFSSGSTNVARHQYTLSAGNVGANFSFGADTNWWNFITTNYKVYIYKGSLSTPKSTWSPVGGPIDCFAGNPCVEVRLPAGASGTTYVFEYSPSGSDGWTYDWSFRLVYRFDVPSSTCCRIKPQ